MRTFASHTYIFPPFLSGHWLCPATNYRYERETFDDPFCVHQKNKNKKRIEDQSKYIRYWTNGKRTQWLTPIRYATDWCWFRCCCCRSLYQHMIWFRFRAVAIADTSQAFSAVVRACVNTCVRVFVYLCVWTLLLAYGSMYLRVYARIRSVYISINVIWTSTHTF